MLSIVDTTDLSAMQEQHYRQSQTKTMSQCNRNVCLSGFNRTAANGARIKDEQGRIDISLWVKYEKLIYGTVIFKEKVKDL